MKGQSRTNQVSNVSTSAESPVSKRKLFATNGSVKNQSLSPELSPDEARESVVPLPVPPDSPPDKVLGSRSILAVFLMVFSAYLGCIFFQGPLLPLSVVCPKVFRRAIDFTMASWFMLAEVLIVKLMGIHVRQFGDHFKKPTRSQPRVSLLLLNHRTQLDWLFIWGLGDAVHRMKIILKESLSRVPGAGWAMQCAGFLFLRRQLATDQIRLNEVVDYLLRVKSSCQLFLFPEGTDLNVQSLARSNQFARKNNLPFVSYTMHPRCTGFVYLVNLLGRDRMTDIYDVTVAYPDNLPAPETNIFRGLVPREVHYHVRIYPASELPWDVDPNSAYPAAESEVRLANWLRARWLEKERMLKAYYDAPQEKRQFDNEVVPDSMAFCWNRDHKPRLTVLGTINLFVWIVCLSLFLHLLATSWLACIYAILVQLAYVYFTYQHNGVSNWALKWVKTASVVTTPQLHWTASTPSFGDMLDNGKVA